MGLECFGGIPATVGGAVFMNAGAFGKQMSDVVTGVDVMDENGNEFYLSASSILWGYRQTSLQTKSLIITRVYLTLKPGNDVWRKYNAFMKRSIIHNHGMLIVVGVSLKTHQLINHLEC